jgi:uncharacterized damage-inducible protein DinB
MPINELERFLKTWDREAENTVKLLRALPQSQYDFRPDQGGRSLGDLDRTIPFFGQSLAIRDILWDMIICHSVHHRGQLALMCRLAGGQAPGLYGPNREEMAAMRAKASAQN